MQLNLTGLDELKIVCDPFCHAQNDEVVLEHWNCYDFFYIGQLERGKWRISLTLDESDPSRFLLSLSRKSYKTKSSRYHPVKDMVLPLYFDGGTNCIHVGTRGSTLQELGLDMGVGVDSASSVADLWPDRVKEE